MAGWNRRLGRSEIAMILGQDILGSNDVEFDLANNVIRFLKPLGCGPQDSLAYWGGAYAEAEFERPSESEPGVIVPATLNGRKMRALLDTGAWTSVVATPAARRAGVQPGSAKAPAVGQSTGVGRNAVTTYLATFDALQIGDQTVSNAKLRLADLFRNRPSTGSRVASTISDDPDMIIGADFFRSHRVLISYSQRRVYFSHKGGPIFQTVGAPMGAELGEVEE